MDPVTGAADVGELIAVERYLDRAGASTVLLRRLLGSLGEGAVVRAPLYVDFGFRPVDRRADVR